jgi:hypothetical protein
MTQQTTDLGTMYHQIDRLIDALREIKEAIDDLAQQSATAAD